VDEIRLRRVVRGTKWRREDDDRPYDVFATQIFIYYLFSGYHIQQVNKIDVSQKKRFYVWRPDAVTHTYASSSCATASALLVAQVVNKGSTLLASVLSVTQNLKHQQGLLYTTTFYLARFPSCSVSDACKRTQPTHRHPVNLLRVVSVGYHTRFSWHFRFPNTCPAPRRAMDAIFHRLFSTRWQKRRRLMLIRSLDGLLNSMMQY